VNPGFDPLGFARHAQAARASPLPTRTVEQTGRPPTRIDPGHPDRIAGLPPAVVAQNGIFALALLGSGESATSAGDTD
jgi:hypothetical protein